MDPQKEPKKTSHSRWRQLLAGFVRRVGRLLRHGFLSLGCSSFFFLVSRAPWIGVGVLGVLLLLGVVYAGVRRYRIVAPAKPSDLSLVPSDDLQAPSHAERPMRRPTTYDTPLGGLPKNGGGGSAPTGGDSGGGPTGGDNKRGGTGTAGLGSASGTKSGQPVNRSKTLRGGEILEAARIYPRSVTGVQVPTQRASAAEGEATRVRTTNCHGSDRG